MGVAYMRFFTDNQTSFIVDNSAMSEEGNRKGNSGCKIVDVAFIIRRWDQAPNAFCRMDEQWLKGYECMSRRVASTDGDCAKSVTVGE